MKKAKGAYFLERKCSNFLGGPKFFGGVVLHLYQQALPRRISPLRLPPAEHADDRYMRGDHPAALRPARISLLHQPDVAADHIDRHIEIAKQLDQTDLLHIPIREDTHPIRAPFHEDQKAPLVIEADRCSRDPCHLFDILDRVIMFCHEHLFLSV